MEVIDAFLSRIANRNPQLNAIVTLRDEGARSDAQAVDEALDQSRDPGPLAGVPFTVKDLIATRGVRSTAGSLLLEEYVPDWGATAVERLQSAGAILIGKTNCPEFGLAIHTGNRLFGDTLNPIDTHLSPGGSSGGDAAAVAAGMAAFGIGTDYGGSIRLPAHCTGLVSYRPTPGVIPGTGQLPFQPAKEPVAPNTASMQARLQTIAPIGHHTSDLWPLMQIMAGPDGIDGNTVPVNLGDPKRVSVKGLRVAWLTGEGTYPVRRDLIRVVETAAQALRELGVRVTARRPPHIEQAEPLYATLRRMDGLPELVAMAQGQEDRLTTYVQAWLVQVESGCTLADYRRIYSQADVLRAAVDSYMAEWPILLLPVASVPAFAPGANEFLVDGTNLHGVQIESCLRVTTLLRAPTAVVPCGSSEEGLPAGVQIVGRPFHDAEVLAVAQTLEQRFGAWRPPDVATTGTSGPSGLN